MKTKLHLLLFTVFLFISANGLAQEKKVALVSFWSERDVSFGNYGGTAAMKAFLARFREDPDFNIQNVVNNFHDQFIENFISQLDFDLVPEEEVVSNRKYQDYEDPDISQINALGIHYFQTFLPAKNYKAMQNSLFYRKKSNEVAMAEIFAPIADGVMFVQMSFNFSPTLRKRRGKMAVHFHLKLCDKYGRKVTKLYRQAKSLRTIPILDNVPLVSTKDITSLCEDACNQLVISLKKRVEKMNKKAAKKL